MQRLQNDAQVEQLLTGQWQSLLQKPFSRVYHVQEHTGGHCQLKQWRSKKTNPKSQINVMFSCHFFWKQVDISIFVSAKLPVAIDNLILCQVWSGSYSRNENSIDLAKLEAYIHGRIIIQNPIYFSEITKNDRLFQYMYQSEIRDDKVIWIV